MPAAYRKTLTRQISQHAHSEIVGMLPEGNWITRAPSLRRKAALLAKVQDGVRPRALPLRRRRDARHLARGLVDQMLAGKAKYSSIFNYPTLSWADIGVIGWLVDGRSDHEPDSVVPLLLRSLCAGDDPGLQGGILHQRQGYEIMVTLSRGSGEQKAMAQEALNRWWWPVLMMFGPPDRSASTATPRPDGRSSAFPTTSLRQKFVDATVPQAQYLGLSIPDPGMKQNPSTGHWEYSTIDWTEFKQVLAGNGPCNRDRMAHGARRMTKAPGCARPRRPMPKAQAKIRGARPP